MEKNLRVLIVEDEFLTLDAIKLGLMDLGYKISGMAKDANKALEVLEEGTTDIAILDINLQGNKDGIWLAKRISLEYKIPFIFLTAYSDNKTIQKAISTEPFGYLVKPFTKTDIYTALEVAIKNYNLINTDNSDADMSEKRYKITDCLFVKKQSIYHKIFIKDILYIKSDSKYIELYVNDETYLLRYGLQAFYDVLPEVHFIQIHRSYVIKKDAVTKIGSYSLFINDYEIPISTQRKEYVLNNFNLI